MPTAFRGRIGRTILESTPHRRAEHPRRALRRYAHLNVGAGEAQRSVSGLSRVVRVPFRV